MQLFLTRGRESRPFLHQVLRRTQGWEQLPELAFTEGGKPYFRDWPALHFNLSHSGDWLLCALDVRPVGVDIECIRPRAARLPRYALSAPEYEAYLKQGGDWTAFYTLWTKKEAWSKYTGEGIGKTWRSPPSELGVFYRHYHGEGFCATVCGEEPPPERMIWLEE